MKARCWASIGWCKRYLKVTRASDDAAVAERAVRAVNAALPEVQGGPLEPGERLMPQAQACATLIEEGDVVFPEAVRLPPDGTLSYPTVATGEAETILRQACASASWCWGSGIP